MAPLIPAIEIPKSTLDALHDAKFIDVVSTLFAADLRVRYELSKADLHILRDEAQKTALLYAENTAHFIRRLPVHLNLIPDSELYPAEIKDLSDEQLAAKYRSIRLSVSSSMTGTLINVILIPFLPAHAIGAVLNGIQTAVTLVNRHHAKAEITRRIAASETSAQIIVVRLNGRKGRAQDVYAGMFFKGVLVAATMGFADICAIPANADALLPHHGVDSALHPFYGGGPGPEIVPSLKEQMAHEALKTKVEAWTNTHPGVAHLPFDTAGVATDHTSNSLDAANYAHYGVFDAPKGSSSIPDLVHLYQEGIPAGAIIAETGLIGLVAEGANPAAIVGDIFLEERWEKHWDRKGREQVVAGTATVAVEFQDWSLWDKKIGDEVKLARTSSSIKRKPVPSRSPSPSPSPSTPAWTKQTPTMVKTPTLREYKRRRGEQSVFLFKE